MSEVDFMSSNIMRPCYNFSLGLQWENGNLRVVNKQGNKLFGSELSVHDRSVDIPVQRWLGIASRLATSYQDPEREEIIRQY